MLFLSANSANSNRKKNPKCRFRTSDQLAFFALYFSFAFISFAGFTADLASADDHPVDEEFTPPPPPILVSGKQCNTMHKRCSLDQLWLVVVMHPNMAWKKGSFWQVSLLWFVILETVRNTRHFIWKMLTCFSCALGCKN